MPRKRKTNEARKVEKEGGEKVKSKSQDCCVTFKLFKSQNFAFCACLNFAS